MAGKKSKKIVLTERERDERRKIHIRIVMGVTAAALFLGGVWWLSTNLGPKRMETVSSPSATVAKAEQERTNAKIAELKEKAIGLKKTFLETEKLQKPGPEAIVTIEDAYQAQAEAVRLMRTNVSLEDERELSTLKALRDKYLAEPLYNESVSREKNGEEELDAGNINAALRELRAAQTLQKQINDEYASSEYRSTIRLVALGTKLADVAALPLYNESKVAEERAKALMEDGDTQGAQTAYTEAIDLVERLRREHRTSAYADMSRQKQLEGTLASVRALMPYERRQAARIAGDSAMDEGLYEVAAGHYQEAVDAQKEINTNHPNSSYASPSALDELETLRQTALSQRIIAEITSNIDAMDLALRERRVAAAVRLLEEVNKQIVQAERNFKRARWGDEELKLKARFLDMVRSDLPALQDQIWQVLSPLGSDGKIIMMNREVPQSLYRQVMGVNPSRNVGLQNPVDSITWAEATEFAQRVGWILGLAVRLPTRAEFELAVGEPRRFVMSSMTWNSQNSGGEVKAVARAEPNMNGYYDLLGNVAEWLLDGPGTDPDDAYIIGGSVRENPARLISLDVQEKPKLERQRFCGFRIVVEMQ